MTPRLSLRVLRCPPRGPRSSWGGPTTTTSNSDEHTTMSSIWQKPVTVAMLTTISANSASSHLGIEFVEIGDDFITARVPVDERTRQPYGLLHGGVSVVLAETLGSLGAAMSSPEGTRAVGLDINANHLRAATSGWVTGTARPIHRGRTTHVWQIELHNDAGQMTCISRITMAILEPKR